MSDSRLIISLFVAFVVLLVVALVQPHNGFRRLPNVEDAAMANGGLVFGDFLEGDVIAVRLGDGSSTLTIAQGVDGWQEPDQNVQLDADTVTRILSTLVVLPYWETIAVNSEDTLQRFGFVEENPNLFSIEVILADGRTHAILAGSLAPTAEGIYTLVDERPIIYVIEPRALEFLRIQLMNPPFA